MLEIRLCSLALAEWLENVGSGSAPTPPHHRPGSMFGNVASSWTNGSPGLEECSRLLAPIGVRFESSELIVSVVHALGIAAAARNQPSETVYQIEAFVRSSGAYANVPRCLANQGVKSAIREKDAIEFQGWIRSVDKKIFEEEVASMFGPAAVAIYSAVARSLQGVFESVIIHHADLACMRDTR